MWQIVLLPPNCEAFRVEADFTLFFLLNDVQLLFEKADAEKFALFAVGFDDALAMRLGWIKGRADQVETPQKYGRFFIKFVVLQLEEVDSIINLHS